MADVDPHSESDVDDLSVQSLSIAHSEPYDWKNEALENLVYIYLAAVQRSSPNVDLRSLTPAIREVISRALVGVEERVLLYAEHVTQAANHKRGEKEAKSLLEIERSFKFYFEEKLRAASHVTGEEIHLHESEETPESEEADLHVRALTQCHRLLMRDLIVRETPLVDRMIENDLISVASGDAVLKKTTDLERNREILRVAKGLNLQQFTASFLPALRDGHKHLADKLVSTMEELRATPRSDIGRGCGVCPLRGRINLRRVAVPLLEKRMIPHDFHDDLLKETMPSMQAWKQLFRHVGHTQKLLPILRENYPGVVEEMGKRDISSLECPCLMPEGLLKPLRTPDFSEDASDIARMSDVTSTLYPRKMAVPEYSMTSGKRGICWVVENNVFAETPKKEKITRNYEGSTKLIQAEFQRLGFQMVRHSNLTAPQLMKEARRMAALDHSQHDCFVCVVRSLSEVSDAIQCSDRAAVGVQDLMEVFNASRCPSLAGKPKVFYLVMGRGGRLQGGVVVPGESQEEHHPDGADFLLIHTALPGFSHRVDDRYVPFHSKHLAEVLQRHAHTQDFLSCLTMANSHYTSRATKSGVFSTAPVTSTLRKALVFHQLRRPDCLGMKNANRHTR